MGDRSPEPGNAAGATPPRPDDRPVESSVALVMGLVSVVLFFPFGPVLGPIAIWVGWGARKSGAPGKGLATAGIVLGSIGLVTGGLFWVLASACDCL